MKSLTLPTGTWLFVKVPKNIAYWHWSIDGKILFIYKFSENKTHHKIDLPNSIFIGLASKISEKMAAQIIPHETWSGIRMYPNYLTASGNEKTSSAIESFATLMQANEMYLKNPMGQHPNKNQYSNTNQGDFLYKFSVNEEWLILKQVINK